MMSAARNNTPPQARAGSAGPGAHRQIRSRQAGGKNKETRSRGEIRADAAEQMHVAGYATVFEREYKLFEDSTMIYYEVIDRHAFDHTDMRDVVMLYNHDGHVLARTTNGTLRLYVDSTGLRITADLSSTERSRTAYEEIKTGLTPQMSFGFTVKRDNKDIKKNETTGRTTVKRRILEVGRVFDVSSVSFPANPFTSIQPYSADEAKRDLMKMLMTDRINQILEKGK